MKAEMEANLKINEERNEKLIKLADEQSDKASFAQSNQSKVQSYIEYNDVRVRVAQAQEHLDTVNEKEGLGDKVRDLVRFRNYWQNNIGKTDIDADEDEDIEVPVEEGELCLCIIDIVEPVYGMYTKGAITFEEYKEKIDLLIKKEAEASDPKETSFEGRVGMESSEVEQFTPSEGSLHIQSQTAKDSLMGTNKFNKFREPSEVPSSQAPTPREFSQMNGMGGSQHSGKVQTLARKPSKSSEPDEEDYGLSSRRLSKKLSKDHHAEPQTFQHALRGSGRSSKMSFKDSYVSSSQDYHSKGNS